MQWLLKKTSTGIALYSPCIKK